MTNNLPYDIDQLRLIRDRLTLAVAEVRKAEINDAVARDLVHQMDYPLMQMLRDVLTMLEAAERQQKQQD